MTTRSAKISPGLAAIHARTLERLLREVRDWARRESLRRELTRERRQLLGMSDATLADLGISRHVAENEARRDEIHRRRLVSPDRDTSRTGGRS